MIVRLIKIISTLLIAIAGNIKAYSANTEVFGRAHLSVGSVSEDDESKNRSTSVTSHASRFGVKGSIDTDSEVKVIYRIVWQVDMSDNNSSSDDHIKSREQFVGLAWNWGQLHIGRDDSPYKLAGKKQVEHLSDTWADYNNIIDKNQDTRNDDSIGYWGKVGVGKLGIQYAAGDDKPASENLGDSWSFAYDIQQESFAAAIAYQTIEKTVFNEETGTKLVLGYKLGKTQLGVIFENVEDDNLKDENNSLISIKHNFDDKNALKFTYGIKDQNQLKDAKMTALAFDHKMGDRISAYALLAKGFDNGLKDDSKIDGDGTLLVVGIIAKF